MGERIGYFQRLHLKDLGVMLLQETHSDQSNEAEWGLWWEGEHILSHGSNLSAGVAVLFSPMVKVKKSFFNSKRYGHSYFFFFQP